MAISEGLGSMLEQGAGEGGKYLPYVGKAYTVYKAFKGFKEGGVSGLVKSFIPFGSSIFGGSKGSRTNTMARQYADIVKTTEDKFINPTIANLNDIKRDVIRGTVRVDGDTLRNILNRFEGAGSRLRDMVGSGDFGSISGHIDELSKLSKGLKRALGGRGAGPDITTTAESGALKLPLPNLEPSNQMQKLRLGNINVGAFAPMQSEGHRFPVTTTQTPGGRRKSRLVQTPGTLT